MRHLGNRCSTRRLGACRLVVGSHNLSRGNRGQGRESDEDVLHFFSGFGVELRRYAIGVTGERRWRTKRSDLRRLVLKERKVEALTLCGVGVRTAAWSRFLGSTNLAGDEKGEEGKKKCRNRRSTKSKRRRGERRVQGLESTNSHGGSARGKEKTVALAVRLSDNHHHSRAPSRFG